MSAAPQSSQRQFQASDPAASAWVSASAGTGKTHVLTDRVLRLLLAGSPPERILCLTFTKAAAAEMANRIQTRLGDWAAMVDGELHESLRLLTGAMPDDALCARARGLFARVLDAPGGLKIQTIHAFCQSTLGRFPLEADIAPHFQAMDERTAGESMATARERVLAAANADPAGALSHALDTVTTLTDEDRFAELIATLAADRGRLGRLLARHGGVDGVTEALRHRLGLAAGDTYDSLAAAAVRDGAFDGTGLQRAAAALATGTPTDQDRGAVIADWLAAPPDRRPDLLDGAYRKAFLTDKDAPRARLATNGVRDGFPGVLDALLEEQERLLRFVDRRKAAATVQSTAALLRLGAALLDAYEGEKRRHALLDYDDLVLKTRDLLKAEGVAPWVLYKLDGGLDHILVDEAQDTNPEQWDVVAALADEFFTGEGAAPAGRTVFAVGDAKQSIYSFQRADPQRFADMEDHFGVRVQASQEAWRPVELVESYRSVPAVLKLVDTVFAQPDARDGVDDRHDIHHVPHRRGQAGIVELWPAIEPVKQAVSSAWELPAERPRHDTASTRLARQIARVIRRWLDSGEVLASKSRPLRPGDIMVLVQRRSTFVEEMVRALKQRQVPVAGVDRMVLTEQLAVMDMVALGRFLLLPGDDLTLATVLKGPLVGFDEDTLFALAYDRGRASLWDVLKDRRDERPAFAAAHALLSDLLGRADYETPYAFYARLLGEEGGRGRIVGRLGPEADDPLDEFLSLALAYERDHAPSLEAFLHWLESGQAEVKRDLEQDRDEVRVLTVHGAKGLQAPVVFLPDTCRTPAAMHEPSVLWLDAEDGKTDDSLLVWAGRRDFEPEPVARVRAQFRQARDREYRRLLYVALTRAADRLYVCGWETSKGRIPGCWYDLIARAMERLAQQDSVANGRQGLRYEEPQTAGVPAGKAAAPTAVSPVAVPDWAKSAPAPEPVPSQPLAPSRPGADEPAVASPLDGPDAQGRFLRGVLIHELLEILPDLPAADRRPVAEAHLAGRWSDAPAAARDSTVGEVLAVLDDARFAHLFGPDSRAEVPLTGLIGGVAVSGQIDRLVVGRDAVVVVDYKSNRPPPATAAEVAPAYLRQMALYRDLLRQIFPDHAIRCVLLWTYGPQLMPLDDTILDRATP